MREILFRAKAINRDKGFHRTSYKNGEWVYGLVTRLYDERFENLPAEMTDINGVSGIEVDYNTISDFTGLTDKNGKKIFEGDIVKVQDDIWGSPFCNGITGKVVYDETAFFIEPKNVMETQRLFNECAVYEVIGNIHDNPELLEGE